MMIVIISLFYLGEADTDLPASGVEGILRDDLAIDMVNVLSKFKLLEKNLNLPFWSQWNSCVENLTVTYSASSRTPPRILSHLLP